MRIEDASQPGSSNDLLNSVNENEDGGADAGVQSSAGRAPTMSGANARVVVPGPDGVVLLPAEVDLDDVRVVGRDLVIDLPDGTQMVIVDGALFMPRLVFGDVELPAANLAALLIGDEIRPAAGPPQSSGGNFALDVGPLDSGLAPGDAPSALLAATAFDYVPPSFSPDSDSLEIEAEAAPDEAPAILIATASEPLGAASATATVSENALGARGAEPAGSDSASTAETVTGTILFFAADAPSIVTINSVAVTGVGQTIAATFGSVTITSIADGAIGYSYTIADNVLGDAANDVLTVEIVDADGDSDVATLTISIVDDVPTASADADSVGESGPVVADGNVLANDTRGADGVAVTAVTVGGASGAIGAPLQGAFGSLVLGADGGYAYTLDAQSAAVLGLGEAETATDAFTYTITDGDGDVTTATLTITISGTNDLPTIAAASAAVSEEGLAGGNGDTAGLPSDATNSASASGQLAIVDVDGDALVVTLGIPADGLISRGQPIVWSLSGDAQMLTGSAGGVAVITVTITDAGAYTVALLGPVDHPDVSGEDLVTLVVPVSVSDGVAAVATALTVSIEDDSPVISAPVMGAAVVIDESDGASPLGTGAPIVATSDSAIISGAPSFGADGPGATVFGLALLGGASSIASGLQTALGDQPITLTLTSATLITATYADGAQTAFTIAMNNDGTVTVTQFVALEHRVDGADHDDVLNLVGDGGSLVSATASYSDFDGDSVTATLAIGAAIQFADDGPSLALALAVPADGAGLAALQLTTSDDGTEGAASSSDSTSAGFGGVFGLTSDGGADGSAGTTLGYQLGLLVAQGAASGLSSGGAAINLYLVNGAVIGSTSVVAPASASDASVVFTLTTDAAGSVTLIQFGQVDHGGESPSSAPYGEQLAILGTGRVELVATATITDLDEDVASDVERLDLGGFVRFADDGPAISAAPAVGAGLRIDETDGAAAASEVDPVGGDLGSVTVAAASLVTVTAGAASADAPTTLSYGLSISASGVASGLLLSSNDAAIVLVDNGGVIEGRAGAVDGALVFTVSVHAASGAVTLTQFLAVEHADPASSDEDSSGLAAGVLSLAVTATDFDGDTASASVDLGAVIRFEDDGPSLDVVATVPADQPGRAALRLVTSDDGTEGDGSTLATSAAAFGGVFSLAADAGADGTANVPALGYALDLLVADGTSSGLTSAGVPIYLHNVGGTIVGSTSIATPASTADASIVFALAVSSGGVATLTQFAQVDHAGDLASLGNGLVELVASAAITDFDGDSASDVERLDLGGFVAFNDDGPAISAAAAAGARLAVDETDGEVAAGESDASGGTLGSTTLAAASLFTVTTGGESADAPTTNAFALSISATGVASGLLLSSSNEAIVLVDNGGVIEGRVGGVDGALAFDVSIDRASGAVTLTQYLAVEHGDAGSNDEASGGLTAGVLSIDITATDFDGDSASASVDLGAIIRFEDDGPTLAVAVDPVAAAGVLITTTDDGTETDITTASGDFGGAFALAFTAGSDGAASPDLAYALGTAVGASGLTSAGAAVNLFNVGGVIVGSTAASSDLVTAANTVFDVSVTAGGIVTLTQRGPIDHAAEAGFNDAPFSDQVATLADAAITLTATATITDNDGDAASDSETIAIGASLRFADDGPAITAALVAGASLRLDESDGEAAGGEVDPLGGNLGTVTVAAASLFSVSADAGADAPASTSYSLSISAPGIASGLLHSATGDAILLVDNAGVIEGRVGAIDGALAFSVSIDPASGATSLIQYLAVAHDDTGSSDEDSDGLATGVLTIDVTATDFDGDTARVSVDLGSIIRFEDDGPASFAPDAVAFANSGTFDNLTAPAALNLGDAAGADGLGSLTFADDNAADDFLRDADGVLVTHGGARIILSGYGTDTLVGSTETGGLTVFTLAVDPGADRYSVDFDRALDDPGLVTLNALGFATTGSRAFNVVNVPGTTEDLLFSGFNRSAANAVTIGSVNSNGTAIGVNNAAMNDGDNLRIDFVNSPTVTTTGGINNVYNYAETPGHYLVNNFSFAVVRVDAATPADGIEIWVRVYDADNSDPPGANTAVHFAELADDQQLAVTAIQVNGIALDLATLTSDGNGGYLVRGLGLDDRVTVSRTDGYGRILIENAGSRTTAPDNSLVGDIFDIGRYAFTTSTAADPLTMNFDLALEDSDGDRIVDNAISLVTDTSAPVTARDSEVAQRASASSANAALMTGAVAAMGLAASKAVAAERDDDRPEVRGNEQASEAPVAPEPVRTFVEPDQGRSLLDNETPVGAKNEPSSPDRAPSADPVDAKESAGEAQPPEQPSTLLASDAPAPDPVAAIVVAPMIVLPSAGAIAAMEAQQQEGGGVQRAGTVEMILAEALEGGAGGGEVDAVLAAITGQAADAGAGLADLAMIGGDAGGWDPGPVVALAIADLAAFHHDAAQPAVNG